MTVRITEGEFVFSRRSCANNDESRIDKSDMLSLVRFLEENAKECSWNPSLLSRANLVVEELVVNSIEHGMMADEINIRVSLASDDRRAYITIADNGKPFDIVRDAPSVDTTLPLEERSVGGLGLEIVRNITSSMSYERYLDQNIVHIEMTK